MNDKVAKLGFLKGQAIVNSIGAAFQHARIYAIGINENDPKRAEVRRALANELQRLAAQYKRCPRSEKHCRNIESLANKMTHQFKSAGVLRNDRFRIGIAQKALNLYLKYLWCLEEIEAPPHCPLDRLIICNLGLKDKSRYDWTKLDNIEAYEELIEKCREHARGTTLPRWELEVWSFQAGL